MHYDMRTQAMADESWTDMSQRRLNAIEPGYVVPIHRHQKTSETVVVLRGRVVEVYYDGFGNVIESILIAPVGDCHIADASRNGVAVISALNIPVGQWHTIRALEIGAVILEMYDGAYEPIQECDVLRQLNLDA